MAHIGRRISKAEQAAAASPVSVGYDLISSHSPLLTKV
jgi:hypothetical protein